MTLAALLLLSAFLDAGTMLMLPPGAERNPFAAAVPLLAVGLKLTVALSLGWLVMGRRRYFRGVGAVGVAAWTVGLVANLVVIL